MKHSIAGASQLMRRKPGTALNLPGHLTQTEQTLRVLEAEFPLSDARNQDCYGFGNMCPDIRQPGDQIKV